MGSDAQGDILYYNGSQYARLGAGTSGQYLKTQGAGANPVWDWSKIAQVVNTMVGSVSSGTTTTPSDDSIPQISEGDSYMSLAIVPKSASSKLKIEVVFNYSNNGSDCTVALFQDSTANAVAAAQNLQSNNSPGQVVFTHYMTSGTTSSTTFSVRAGGTGGTVVFNGITGPSRRMGGVMASSITISEVN
jgi:hypothetical protein